MGKIRRPRKSDLPKEESTIQQVDATQQQVQAEVSALENEVSLAPQKRIWEVDFLRGFMILFVVWDHFMWDLGFFHGGGYKTGFFQWLYDLSVQYRSTASNSLRNVTHDTFVTLFVFTSGVSCSFSKSNGKRAIKMMCFALLLSAVTYAASSVVGFTLTINFNVIHVVALSAFLWACLEWLTSKFTKDWHHNLYGWIMCAVIVTVLIVGYSTKAVPLTDEKPFLYFLVEHDDNVLASFLKFKGGDYLPFFPDFGWFLVGAFLGKKLYKEKTSLFPTFNDKWVAPFTFVGRNSIWVYFGSQVVMAGFFYLFASLWKIL